MGNSLTTHLTAGYLGINCVDSRAAPFAGTAAENKLEAAASVEGESLTLETF